MMAIYRFLLRYPRTCAAAVLCAGLAAIFVGGAQPFAVNLIAAPWDKFAHAAVFSILGACAGVIAGIHSPRAILVAAGTALLAGALDEWHQTLLPGRHAGWDDFAADAVGALLAGYLVWSLRSALGRTSAG